jgi:ubiquinone/menaquinone biosynthesis C-methylase UbiE
VLDVPCGTGKFSEYLADAGLAVTGLDISHTAIRVAARRGVAPLLQGDAVDMPVADDAYDAVFCHGFSLFNEPDLGRLRPFVREVGRVLAPGGTLLWGKTTTHRDESVGSRYDHSRASLEHFFDGFDDLAVTGSFVTVPHLSYVLRGRDLNTPVTAVLERLSSGLGLPTRLYLIVERR